MGYEAVSIGEELLTSQRKSAASMYHVQCVQAYCTAQTVKKDAAVLSETLVNTCH